MYISKDIIIWTALLAIACISLVTCYLICVILDNKDKKQTRELKRLELNLNYQIKESDFSIIDKLVEETFGYYQITNYEINSAEYITPEMQNRMIEAVLTKVITRISPLYINKLSYVYNKDYIEDIILEKIKLKVIDFAIERNSDLQE